MRSSRNRWITGLWVAVAVALAATAMTPARSSADASSQPSSWVGVGELVVAQLDANGNVSGAPYQHTEITATGTVKVEVPMSSSGERDLGKGKPPPVKDGAGDFSYSPNGTTTQNVRSNLATPLPLTVKPTYELNGKSVTADDLDPTRNHLKKQYENGTLQVTYNVTNVSKETTNVSLVGFNGAQVKQTITQPLPIVAEVKLTFPKDASNIAAPGASLATSVASGVAATWTLALAPPLSPATQTISYTVHLGKVKVPEATVEAEVLAPKSLPSGNAPAKSAAAFASVEGTPEKGLDGPSVSLGGVHSDLDKPQRSMSANLDTQQRSKKNTSTDRSNARSSIGGIQGDVGTVAQNQSFATQSLGVSAGSQLNALQDTANQALGNVVTSANPSQLTSDLSSAMTAMTGSISNLALLAVANNNLAENHAVLADALKTATSALLTLVTNLLSVVTQHVSDVSVLDALIVKLIADANGFSTNEQSMPEWITLAGDLATAKLKADALGTAAADIESRVSAVVSAVQDLEGKVASLDTEAHGLESDASGFRSTLTGDVATKEQGLEMSIAAVSNRVAAVNAQFATGAADISTATNNAKTKVNGVEQAGSAAVADATDKAKASVQTAVSSAQAALDKANDHYAQYVALSQIAIAHQLPGGNATGATVQNGAWVYRISGTS